MPQLKQSSTAQPLLFLLVLTSDHISGATGLTPTVTLSKNGGAFASPAGAVSEIANGWYKVAGNATDTGTLGPLVLHATGTGTDPVDLYFDVVAYDSQDAVHLGMSALPNTACTTNASLLTSGTGTDQISVTTGRVDVGKALGTAVTLDANSVLNVSTKYIGGTLQTARDLGASVLLSTGTGTGQLDFTSGVVKSNSVQWLGGTIPAVNVTGVPLVDAKYLLGTIFATPATAGVLDVNAKNINNVSAASVTTISANLGTTQPLNFTGTGASALVQSDMQDIAGAAVSTTTAQIGVRVVNAVANAFTSSNFSASTFTSGQFAASFFNQWMSRYNATAQAGGASTITLDSGASATDHIYEGEMVLITSGTGANQTRVIIGYVGSTKVATVDSAWTTNPDNTSQFNILAQRSAKLDSSLQVTAASVQGNVTGSVASVTGAVGSVTGAVGSVTGNVGGSTASVTAGVTLAASQHVIVDSGTVTTLTNLPAITANWFTATGIDATAVTKIQAGLSTYAGGAVASVTGNVGGDLQGKVIGGGASTITGTGAQATLAASQHVIADSLMGYVAPDNTNIGVAAAQATTAATQATTAATQSTTAANQSAAIAAILGGITSLAKWLRAGFRKSTPDATALSEINLGGGTYDATEDAQEAIRDHGDVAWVTGSGGGGGGGGSGSGDTPVTENTGGADNLRAVDSNGNGLDNVIITAYLTSDWTANPITATALGQIQTKADGRFVNPLMLNAGLGYTLVYQDRGYQTVTKTVTP